MTNQTSSNNDTGSTTGNVVIVGVDGSEPSVMALRWGRFMAESSGSRLVAVTAYTSPAAMYGADWVTLPDWDPQQTAKEALDATLAETLGDVPVSTVVREGSAANVILDEGTGAHMIVVGSRGHGGFKGLLLGSVSSAVAEHAKCPVLVVHGDTAPPPSA